MKRLALGLILATQLGACATMPADHEGLRATREMTDMDGKPIDPGFGTLGPGAGIGIGIGVGAHRGRFGAGFGMGW